MMDVKKFTLVGIIFDVVNIVICQGSELCRHEDGAMQEANMCTRVRKIGGTVLLVDDAIPSNTTLSCVCDITTSRNIQVEMLYSGPLNTNCGMELKVLDYVFSCADGFVKPNISGQVRITYVKKTDTSDPEWCLKLSSGVSIEKIDVHCHQHGVIVPVLSSTTKPTATSSSTSTTGSTSVTSPETYSTTSQSVPTTSSTFTHSSITQSDISTTVVSTSASTNASTSTLGSTTSGFTSSSYRPSKLTTKFMTSTYVRSLSSTTEAPTITTALFITTTRDKFESTTTATTTPTPGGPKDVPMILVILVPVGGSLILVIATVIVLIACQTRRPRRKSRASVPSTSSDEPSRRSYIDAFVDNHEGMNASSLAGSAGYTISSYIFGNECYDVEATEKRTHIDSHDHRYIPKVNHYSDETLEINGLPKRSHHKVQGMPPVTIEEEFTDKDKHEPDPAYETVAISQDGTNFSASGNSTEVMKGEDNTSNECYGTFFPMQSKCINTFAEQRLDALMSPEESVVVFSHHSIDTNSDHNEQTGSLEEGTTSQTPVSFVPRIVLDSGAEYATVVKNSSAKSPRQPTVTFKKEIKVHRSDSEPPTLKGILKNSQHKSESSHPRYARIRKFYSNNNHDYTHRPVRAFNENEDDLKDVQKTTTTTYLNDYEDYLAHSGNSRETLWEEAERGYNQYMMQQFQ